MKLFRRLAALREENHTAATENKKLLEQAETAHAVALEMQEKSAEQARALKAQDQRNHYSESLTKSFRGKPA